ncbi:hypothetical protein V2J09_005387 [Rumex salicifolius]
MKNLTGEEKKKVTIIDLGSIDSKSLLMEGGEDSKTEPGRRRFVNKLSERQMESLTALCDTFLPSLDVPNGVVPVDEPTLRFFKASAATTRTPDHVGGLISENLVYHQALGIKIALFLLSTWMGTLIFAGFSGRFHRFSGLQLKTRQQIILSWSSSPNFLFRILFFGVKALILLSFFTQVDDNNQNPYWEAIGYCGPDPDFKSRSKTSPKQPTEPNSNGQVGNNTTICPIHRGLLTMSYPIEVVVQTLRWSGFQVSIHQKPSPTMTIQCDVVVVGSGSGGSVVAGELAKAGYKVLVLEKGPCITRQNLSLLEGQSMNQMYEGGGIVATQDAGVMILAGSTVGGGSTINWSASIKTPDHVMRDWSDTHDLELFDTNMYQEAMDLVCNKMEVQTDIVEEGLNNEVLRKGCMELGYPVHNIPRNAPPDHYCGWCNMGCKDGGKKGTIETWLRDLVESDNGFILPGCEAKRVLYTKGKGGGKGRAKGVEFEYKYKGIKEVCVVEANVTIVACGALNTPVLLRRSGLKNPNIGRNLHLHPVVMAWGVFPEDSDIDVVRVEDGLSWRPERGKKSYEGGIMTAMSPVVANFEGSGYGALIQTPSLHPGMFSALIDKTSGEIISQNPKSIHYKLSSTDESSLNAGVEKMLRILAAAGAEEIGTHHRDGPRLNVKKASFHEFERFVKTTGSTGLKAHKSPISSAHQMGSCRMGVDPETSAVDQRGETWEVEGLFVADTSVFPTALGVNPMVTVMSISYCTAQAVLEVLKRKRRR